MAADLDVSIVLCTKNRAPLLRDALESLLSIDSPPSQFELVLVDNGSSDDTKAVVQEFTARAPFAVQYHYEATPGLSAARNRGIREARGSYLFFTDDDQLVDPAALREHLRVARKYDSRVQQGAIALEFPEGRPAWLSGRLAVVLGQTDSRAEGPADMDLFGGNMFFRRSLFEDGVAFREDLGKGTSGYSEDIEITRRLSERGERVVFAPSATVFHVIGADRANPRFFRKNSWEKGYSDGLLTHGRQPLPRALLVNAVLAWANLGLAVFHAVGRDQHRRVVSETRAANRLGKLVGALAARRKPSSGNA